MAYNQKISSVILPPRTVVEASAADVFTWIVEKPMIVRDVSIIISEVVALDTTEAVASLDHTPVGGARTEKATLTTVTATALGAELIASEVSGVAWVPFFVEEGDILYFEHKTQGVDGGTATGDYRFKLYFEYIPDGVV